MSHDLEIINGQAQMAYVGETPWHGLGVRLEEGVTPLQMQQAAGLDWDVEKINTTYMYKGDVLPTGRQALVRSSDGKILSEVGKNWNPVQNSEAFQFFDDFCKEGKMQMHTAGSLKDGQIVWALAKLSSDFELFNGDKVEGYLLFSNPHQFGKCVDVRFSPIRVVCNNTLTLAINSKSSSFVKMDHRNLFNPEAVKETLGIAGQQMDEYKQTAEFLGSKAISDESVKRFLSEVLGGSKKEGKELSRSAQLAYDVLETQPGAEFARGTWWSALNAVTYVTDHQLGRNNDSRLQSVWFGSGRVRKIEAVKKAVEYAEAA